MTKETLKPCPFCGNSEVEIVESIVPRRFAVRCDCDIYFDCRTTTREAAAIEWNTRTQPAQEPILAKHQPCGCVVCTCDTEDTCLGCGARNCGKHPPGEIPNPVYAQPAQEPVAKSGEIEFAAIIRNRSGMDAGEIDFGIKSARVDELSDSEKRDICFIAERLHATLCSMTGNTAPPAKETVASSQCPVCGKNSPHGHSEEQIGRWINAQASRFGYVATIFNPEYRLSDLTRFEVVDLCDGPEFRSYEKGQYVRYDDVLRISPANDEAVRLSRIAEIIESVDHRAQFGAVVTPTLQEMTQEEISEIYALAKGDASTQREQVK